MMDVMKQFNRTLGEWQVSLYELTSHPSGISAAQKVELTHLPTTNRWEINGHYSWPNQWDMDVICGNLVAMLSDTPEAFTGPKLTYAQRDSICAVTDLAMGLEL